MSTSGENTPYYREDAVMQGLEGINNYLAMINSRMEILMSAGLPEYVMNDLIQVCQAEKEASQIVRNMKIICYKSHHQGVFE